MDKSLLLVVPLLWSCGGIVDLGYIAPSLEADGPQAKPRVLQMQVRAGGMCGLFDDEKVRCWSAGGDPTVFEAPSLRGVALAGADYWGEHGLTCVIDREGDLTCIDTPCPVSTVGDACINGPALVPHPIAVQAPITAVSLDEWGGVALRPDGTFQPWGGEIPECFNPPHRPPGPKYDDFAYDWILDPVSLESPVVALGSSGLCFVSADSRVRCTLANLGTSAATCVWPPAPVPDIDDAVAVSTGGPICILHRSGQVTCFGNENWLGIGATSTDQAVSMPAGIDDAIEVQSRNDTTCVIRSDHTLWCWGLNQSGQAGQRPTPEDREVISLPERVEAVEDVRVLGMANQFTCAAEATGDIWCWGSSNGYRPYRLKL